MGGGSNSSPPTDVAPGGGTFPVDAFGNTYNPQWGSSQMYGGVGQAFQQFGNSMQNQPVPNYMTGAPTVANIPGAPPQTNLIPVTTTGNDGTIEALMRLLGGLS